MIRKQLLMATTCLQKLHNILFAAVATLLFASGMANAQSRTPDAPPLTPLAEAQAALERRDWSNAEILLKPLISTEPKNPFAYFELAQLYENTNRVEAARNIYQAIAAIPEAEKSNYVVIAIKDNKKSMVLLPNLAQEKLNALTNSQAPATQSPVTARSAAPIAQPAPPPVRSSTTIENTPQVIAMRQWLAAWQSKQLDAYFASYVAGFQGDLASQAAWQKARSTRITSKTKININAYDVSITPIDAQQMQVSFTQAYVSPKFTNLVKKTLLMVNNNGRWLIAKETVK
jgi:hypothetical protein